MGAVRAGNFKTVGLSNAQVIGGSLRFDSSKNHYLSRTPGSAGNRTTWTWSGWLKRSKISSTRFSIFTAGSDGSEFFFEQSTGADTLTFYYYNNSASAYQGQCKTTAVFRDISSWYHIVLAVDTTQGTAADRCKIYVNGVQQLTTFVTNFNSSASLDVNNTTGHYIGRYSTGTNFPGDFYLSNVYFIDGQALTPSYFGYTDPLTNTWRPKKLSSSIAFGTNGFYLPFDGNSPIGQDQSGRGNNWTPVNFGGSNTIEKATGALPILNTDGGGKVARVGVRTDTAVGAAVTCVLALPLVGIKSDFSNSVDSRSSNKAITLVGSTSASSSSSMFYGGSFYFDGNADCIDVASSSDFAFGTSDFTVECWVNTSTYSADGGFARRIFMTDGPTGNASGNFQLILNTSDGALYLWSNTGDLDYITTGIVANGNWNHIAACRSGSTLRAFVNGVQVGSTTYSGSISPNSGTPRPRIGNYDGSVGSGDFSGYIQDFRIYKGVAKYTQNFIPASTDPDILPDTPSGVAYSSNVALVPSTDGAVAFDGSGDYLSLTSGTDFQFGSGNFTVEAWIYPNSLSNYNPIMDNGSIAGNNQHDWRLYLGSVGEIWFDAKVGGTDATRNGASGGVSNGVVTKKWQHIAVTRSGNTIYTFLDGVQVLSNSFSSTIDSNYTTAYIGYDVMVAGGNYYFDGFISNLHVVKGTALYTSNFTPPTAPITSVANTKLLCCKSNSSATAYDVSPGSISFPGSSISAFRDSTSSNQTWDNSSVSSSTSQALGPDDIYWSDLGETCTVTTVTFTVNVSSSTNISLTNFILYYSTASNSTGSSACSSGCTITVTPTYTGSAPGNVYVTFSGLNLSARYLGITNGSGTYSGTLTYSNVVITVDAPAPTNFNPFTVNINTQRGQESGYCTLNPLDSVGITLTNGNLNPSSTSAAWANIRGTIGVLSGKWYWEVICTGVSNSNNYAALGIADSGAFPSGSAFHDLAKGYSYYSFNGQKYNAGSGAAYGDTYTTNDVIGVALDLDAGTLKFYKNNMIQNSGTAAYTSLSGTFFPAVGLYGSSCSVAINFGQKPFKFPPPAGFQPLALANTPRPTIVRPDQYVGIVTYTPNTYPSAYTVSNLGFKPDLVWTKSRTGVRNHALYDSVRNGAKLYPNQTFAENVDAAATFNRNGFTLSADGDDTVYYSESGVAWCWKAGGSGGGLSFWKDDIGYSTASAAGLTAGTITPTGASINTKSGFSIITYTGTGANATIPHGLGNAPAFIITKTRDSAVNWIVYHKGLTTTYDFIRLNTTDQKDNNSTVWNTSPTTSVFGVGSANGVNQLNDRYVSYLWTEIPGFSKFGSYKGGGSSYPYINTGFAPAWVMIKDTSTGGTYYDWHIFDNKRNPYNLGADNADSKNVLFANLSAQENQGSSPWAQCDFLSNGFRVNDQSVTINNSGSTYIYAAFAESPSFNLYGGQSNAR